MFVMICYYMTVITSVSSLCMSRFYYNQVYIHNVQGYKNVNTPLYVGIEAALSNLKVLLHSVRKQSIFYFMVMELLKRQFLY